MTFHGALAARGGLVAFLALAALAFAAPGRAGELPTLVMGVNYWPPYLYPPGHELAPGLAQVIVSRCAGDLGYDVEYRGSDVPEIFAALQDGSFDVHVLSFKADRAEYLEYGQMPLFEAAYRPFVAAGSDIEVDSIDDFDGLRLGHKRSMRYTDEFLAYVDGRRREGTLVELESENEIVQQLASGDIDIAVMMLSSGVRRASALGLLDQVRVLDYDLKTASYPLAVSKRSRHLADGSAFLADFDACLRRLGESGELDEIFDRFSDLFGE